MTGLDLVARIPERDVDLTLGVPAGRTLALLGPNGAGKSTALAVAAGLLRSPACRVGVGGRRLDDVPTHHRGVAMLSQDPLLFPHLSVLDNVAFAPRAQGVRRSAARAAAWRWLDEVGVSGLAQRRPGALSGGQSQRVAIARALAAEPEVLLLDEPMAALDVSVTPALRQLLRRVLAERTVLLVTHDALDAVLLADRVAVIEHGRVVEEGPTQQVLERPRSRFAARIAGLNLITGRWHGGALEGHGLRVQGVTDGLALAEGSPAVAVFAPSAVSVFGNDPGGSPRNAWPVVVTDLEPREDRVRVRADTRLGEESLAADVTPAAVADLGLEPGVRVRFAVKATEVTVHPAGPDPEPPASR
ncbi:sulfate/molybdate ABC transporter ATP-binding protein [Nocardioides insulae]|uniref:sulfate/molybdate ABC transporter ATP-binding protein n=1 Tax=Nocardioides insulae TaxID=394734 RepID=UPI000403808C|nr:ATP-binding cassette domain-containing protein [Nocardioides insulae]